MTTAISIAAAVRRAAVDVVVDAVDAGAGAGTIEVRSGVRPATADDAATGTVLVTFTCADPAFGAASGTSPATATLNTSPVLSAVASNTGTATWARVKDSSGATVFDGGVATSGEAFTISSTSITSGATLTLSAGTVSLGA
jgi:hypothetical protein